jgi:ribosomal protein L24E
MSKCVYCGNVYEVPRGLTLVMNNGTINHLCSSKCRKNMVMKRRKVRWISKKTVDKKPEVKKSE